MSSSEQLARRALIGQNAMYFFTVTAQVKGPPTVERKATLIWKKKKQKNHKEKQQIQQRVYIESLSIYKIK